MSETAKRCSGIRCREYAPTQRLRPYISCYWAMRSKTCLEKPVPHRVIPDGCVDMIFDLDEGSSWQTGVVVGTMTRPIFAHLKGRVNYVAVRFLPGGCLNFLDGPMCDFTDRVLPLGMITGKEGRNITEQLAGQNRNEDRIRVLEHYLLRLLRTDIRGDSLVRTAVSSILRSGGNIRVSELSGITGTGARQLHRNFERWIGVGPKAFCRIIRFQNFLRKIKHCLRADALSVALDCGYYDQSHFIHEFGMYCGLTPSEFFRRNNL